MKRYIDKLHSRPVHEKREFAVHAAAGVIALVFLVWLSTLGVRFAGSGATTVADTNATNLIAATAAAGQAIQAQMRETEGSSAPSQDTGTSGETVAVPQTAPATVIGAPNDPATTLSQ